MGDCFLGMSCGRLNLRSMLHRFLEMLDPFTHMRVVLRLFGMLESFLGMLFQGIGMLPFALLDGCLGMCQRFSFMLISSKRPPADTPRER